MSARRPFQTGPSCAPPTTCRQFRQQAAPWLSISGLSSNFSTASHPLSLRALRPRRAPRPIKSPQHGAFREVTNLAKPPTGRPGLRVIFWHDQGRASIAGKSWPVRWLRKPSRTQPRRAISSISSQRYCNPCPQPCGNRMRLRVLVIFKVKVAQHHKKSAVTAGSAHWA